MAMQYSCDFCGEPITDDGLMLTIRGSGPVYDPDCGGTRYVAADLGHYHADEDHRCWAEMTDRILLIHAVSSDLGPDREAIERRIELRATRQCGREQQKQERENYWREYQARKRAWRETPQQERERILLEVLGNDRLLLRELAERMTVTLWGDDRTFALHDATIRALAAGMLQADLLERVPDPRGGAARYRWRRKLLDGPIVDLERAYHDDDEAVA